MQPSNIQLRVHPPQIKLKSKLLIRSSPNFTHIKIVSMRPPILNFRSISQFWQPWARNWQHCGSEKYAFVKNPTPPTVFAAHSSKFAQTLTTKLQRASRSRIFDFNPRSPLKKFKNFQKFLKVDFSMKFWLWAVLKKFWEANSKIRLLEALCNLVVSVCAKFEECAAKTVGGVGFLRVTGFSKKHYCQISSHGCQFDGLDFKLSKHD